MERDYVELKLCMRSSARKNRKYLWQTPAFTSLILVDQLSSTQRVKINWVEHYPPIE